MRSTRRAGRRSRELRNVLAAVRSARQDATEVRVVPFAAAAAIRDELARSPAHVLHISGPSSPGILVLEGEDGRLPPTNSRGRRPNYSRNMRPPGCTGICHVNKVWVREVVFRLTI